jgi:hypothetical protein
MPGRSRDGTPPYARDSRNLTQYLPTFSLGVKNDRIPLHLLSEDRWILM